MTRLCVCLLFFLLSPLALAQNPPASALDPAIAAYNDQRFPQAITLFQAIAQDEKRPTADRIEAYKYLGFIHLILNKSQEATDLFRRLLELQPTYTLNPASEPPKFLGPFEEARKGFLADRLLQIQDLSPRNAPAKEPLPMRFVVLDPKRLAAKVVLWYRSAGQAQFTSQSLQESKPEILQGAPPIPPQGRFFTFTVPPLPIGAGVSEILFEYYVEITDARNFLLASLGSLSSPQSIRRTVSPGDEQPPAPPFYRTWWFWTIVGVVVVGGAAGGIAAAIASQPPPVPTTASAVITLIR